MSIEKYKTLAEYRNIVKWDVHDCNNFQWGKVNWEAYPTTTRDMSQLDDGILGVVLPDDKTLILDSKGVGVVLSENEVEEKFRGTTDELLERAEDILYGYGLYNADGELNDYVRLPSN